MAEITQDDIENACDDLKCEMENVLNNDGDSQDEMYDNAINCIRNIQSQLDSMLK